MEMWFGAIRMTGPAQQMRTLEHAVCQAGLTMLPVCPMDRLAPFTSVGGKSEPPVRELSDERTWDISLPQRVMKPWDKME